MTAGLSLAGRSHGRAGAAGTSAIGDELKLAAPPGFEPMAQDEAKSLGVLPRIVRTRVERIFGE